MSDRDDLEYQIRRLEDKVDDLKDEVRRLNRLLIENAEHTKRLERTESGSFNSWIMISLFYIIVIVSIMILPMAIRSVPTTPPPQNITIQMPPPAAPVVEEQKPSAESKTVEETPVVEEQPSQQSRTSTGFLLGLFEDLPSAVQHAMMCGIVIFLFKLVMD